MELGAPLPVIPISGGPPSLAALRADAEAASRLGYPWPAQAAKMLGRFHATAGVELEPRPEPGRPPTWLAGWGPSRGLSRR